MNSTSRLKILHADTDDLDNPLGGGQPVRTFQVYQRMADRHDITVLTSVYKGCRRRMQRGGVHYHRLGFRVPGLGLSPHLTFLAALGPRVRRMPHDIAVEEFTPPIGFCDLPRWTAKPVVLVVQWYFFDQWEKRYRLPFSRWMRRAASRGRYRHVIVQSAAMRDEFASFLPDADIRVIPPGIDDAAFQESSGPGEYVLFLGRLDTQHKGLDLLLEAWRKGPSKAGVPLVLAGEGPARAELETAVSREQLGSLVRFAGRLEGSAKRDAIARARLLVMPSRYETFGLSALDAMAAGKPVVCFDIPHLNEVVTEACGEKVPAGSTDALADAVCRLWQRPERCVELGRAGRERARRYRWEAISRQQEDFYLEIHSTRRETAQNRRLLPLGLS